MKPVVLFASLAAAALLTEYGIRTLPSFDSASMLSFLSGATPGLRASAGNPAPGDAAAQPAAAVAAARSETEKIVAALSAPAAAQDAGAQRVIARLERKVRTAATAGSANVGYSAERIGRPTLASGDAAAGAGVAQEASSRDIEAALKAAVAAATPAPVVEADDRVAVLDERDQRQLGELVDAHKLPAIDVTIEFPYKSAELTEQALPMLDRLGAALGDGRLKDATFVVAGHTDAVGSRAYNKGLSLARAKAVRKYLATKFGIKNDSLVAIGYGKDRLKNAGNPTADENRRVEFVKLVR